MGGAAGFHSTTHTFADQERLSDRPEITDSSCIGIALIILGLGPSVSALVGPTGTIEITKMLESSQDLNFLNK